MSRHSPRKRRRSKPRPPSTSAETHWCSRCRKVLPLSKFSFRKRSGKPRSWCKACECAHEQQRRRQNPDRARARDRRNARRRQAARIAYESRPERRLKRAAYQVVYWAVRSGMVEKPETCERCGAKPPPRRLHAHHLDYAKPLEIVWLCSLCHGEEHRKTRDEGT